MSLSYDVDVPSVKDRRQYDRKSEHQLKSRDSPTRAALFIASQTKELKQKVQYIITQCTCIFVQ